MLQGGGFLPVHKGIVNRVDCPVPWRSVALGILWKPRVASSPAPGVCGYLSLFGISCVLAEKGQVFDTCPFWV